MEIKISLGQVLSIKDYDVLLSGQQCGTLDGFRGFVSMVKDDMEIEIWHTEETYSDPDEAKAVVRKLVSDVRKMNIDKYMNECILTLT